jgi:hypothetical protein
MKSSELFENIGKSEKASSTGHYLDIWEGFA